VIKYLWNDNADMTGGNMSYSIAIDGPAGAGKSTIAKKIAKELSFIYVDTGAMYRAMALYFLQQGISSSDEEQISRACGEVSVDIRYEDGQQQVYLNGENVTSQLRTEQVGNMASATSVYPDVRSKLVWLQRQLADNTDVIMDGRDIGTCVLPHATVKIYLTASVHTRAKRRYDELVQKETSGSEQISIEEIEADIEQRDERDMSREISPLRQAEDAILVDSSDLTIDEVTQRIIALFREKCANGRS
jgi:cytidylate kinase